jgi:hypothetical protein
MNVPEGCDPNIPNLSVGDYYVTTLDELREFKAKHNVYLVGISSSRCDKCCQGEIIMDQVHKAFVNKEVAYKGKQIPVLRIDFMNFIDLQSKFFPFYFV